jgi:hypothetical protein
MGPEYCTLHTPTAQVVPHMIRQQAVYPLYVISVHISVNIMPLLTVYLQVKINQMVDLHFPAGVGEAGLAIGLVEKQHY